MNVVTDALKDSPMRPVTQTSSPVSIPDDGLHKPRQVGAGRMSNPSQQNSKSTPELICMEIYDRRASGPAAVEAPGGHRHLRRILGASVMPVVCALLLVGPAAAAEAQSSVSRTNAVARTPIPAGVTLQTQDTQLTAADRNLLVNVRLAGLWEIPAGKMAMTKGVSPRVRQIGQMIASQHVRLDAIDRAAAKEVGVALPDQPNPQQRRWLDEMTDASGSNFDDIFVDRLRAAHGKIFPAIAVVRATTDNDTVRKLAQSANAFVLTHMTLLE